MFSIKSETVALGSPMVTLAVDKMKVLLKQALLWGGKRGSEVIVPLSSNVISQDFFFAVVKNTLNWFWQWAAGVTAVWHRSQEKATPEAADLSFSVQIRACPASCLPAPSLPAWWVAGVLPGSSATWPRTRLPARPLLKAEVSRKPKWLFLVGG